MALLRRGSDAYVKVASRSRHHREPVLSKSLDLVVEGTRAEAEGVLSITLGLPDGAELPRWHPGAHIDLTMPSGRVRQYSLCGKPTDRKTYRIAVRRSVDGGGGSMEAHTLEAGSLVSAGLPRNAFPFVHANGSHVQSSRVVFIAAGIGITAILPMVRSASEHGADWYLSYIGRNRASMPFLDELVELDPGGDRIELFTGTRRSPTRILNRAQPGCSVYCCGPAELMSAVRSVLDDDLSIGFHMERFAPAAISSGTPFTVRTADTTVDVDAETSALDAIRRIRPDVAYSCRQGFCGTCRVRVLGGTVEHRGRSNFLHDPQSMLICVDRAVGPEVTLDL